MGKIRFSIPRVKPQISLSGVQEDTFYLTCLHFREIRYKYYFENVLLVFSKYLYVHSNIVYLKSQGLEVLFHSIKSWNHRELDK